VLEGAPGLIAGNFKHAEFLTEDSQGLIRKLSSFDEVGLNEEWLYIKGILQHWGEPDDRENSLLLYYVSGHYDPNIPAREQNLAYVDEVAGEIHELAAWRNGESLEPESAQRFVFGEIPLYGTYDEIRRVLGRPSAFVPDARWVPEMPSMVQWNFLIGDAPRRIVVVVCVAFREARVRRTVVNIAYEELR